MQVLTCSLLLLATATITFSMKVEYWGTDAEREAIINEAVSEARLRATLRDEANQASINDNKPLSASMKLARGFKKPSARVAKAGKARIFIEDAVHRAERKLFKLKETDAQSMSAEARAEEIATELFHRPGRFLKEEELAKIYVDSDCITERSPAGINCSQPSRIRFRTIDGTCNNLVNVTDGASETDFRRLAPPIYEDGISSLLGTTQFFSLPEEEGDLSQILKVGPFQPPYPSARLVSVQIIRDRELNEFPASHILMQWGQFLDHDLDLGPELEAECEGCIVTEICQPIRVPKDDLTFGIGTFRNGECLPLRRSIPSCEDNRPGSFEPREQINALTSFIDGSMVYGSTEETENVVRLFKNGLLRTGPPAGPGQRDTLPTIRGLEADGVENVREVVACMTAAGDDCFVCGDVRCNEQVSLSIMHTIWLREHNRLATELKRINAHWDDDRLFQEARAIVGALIQKITYLDYLPVVLGPRVFDAVIGPFIKYNPEVDPSVPNSFATAAYRYGHSLIQPEFARLDANYDPLDIGPLPLQNAFFNPSAFADGGGTDPILLGLVNTSARRVDESLSSPLTNQLFENPDIAGSGMDLASLNIQRSRDHGLPSYTIFKRFCQTVFPGLEFSDIENQLTFVKLLQAYGSLETVELWVGGLSEERLEGSLLGATFSCLFGLTFRNVRDGDRFYFESPTSSLTASQMTQIRIGSLSRVLCDNGDNILTIQSNAFVVDQPRISCASIPPISLGPWRENACFARLGSSASDLTVVAFSSLSTPFILETFTNEDVPECLPFICPTEILPSFLAVFMVDSSIFCSVAPNTGLPPNQVPSPNFYISEISSGDVTAENGLHTSLKSCQGTSTPAFTFTNCGLQTPFAQGEEKCRPGNPDCELKLPEGLQDILNKKTSLYAATFSDENSVKEQAKVEDNFASQQELLHELENDLKQLNQ